MSKLANDNCLKGFKCPDCGSLGPFAIVSTVVAIVNDDGVNEYLETEWNEDSPCQCVECTHEDIVSHFCRMGQG